MTEADNGKPPESDIDRRLREAIETGAPINIVLGFEPDRREREGLEEQARWFTERGIDLKVTVDRQAQKARVEEKIGAKAERWFK